MSDYLPLLGSLFALLIGLIVGKAWERYKLRDGRWIDRRRLRETPHYMLGLNFLVDQQVDQAIDELTQATSVSNTDALEIQMILGNLYRAKGQVGRAITLHQSLLQRPDLTKLEQAYVQLCLALDFRHGGFIDRALEAFQEVVRLDPRNRYALVNLQKLYEEQDQWADALRIRAEIAKIGGGRRPEDQQILAFLTNEIGTARVSNGDADAAGRTFAEAIDIDTRTAPAYLNLGDIREKQGKLAEAIQAWESLAREVPDRAHLAFERLERAYAMLGSPRRFVELCERLITQNPQDWRARLALAKHLAAQSRHREALEQLLEALPHNPHGLAIHAQIWLTLSALGLDPLLVRRYMTLTNEAVFYFDPHVCTRCRYRSTELLWQCPQCHEWNTFVEERLSPAKDSPTAELEPIEP
ncbi:MAG TPA: tetratricopeptide repeat protein [Vicinamibacterales bacterium]|jgi:lipopolysaccharide assembly protein B|nr:tetratricopeptide repeat protein [Vicinamibacterales bacterium]